MKYVASLEKSTGEATRICYEDVGEGIPIVLIHGWPLDMRMWEYQVGDLVNAGLRVIRYDRRGFGESDKPWNGYDYETLADDLNAVMEALNLRNAVLVGFSMGGGEVVRYLNNYGSRRVSRIVLISSVLPCLMKTGDNADGVEPSVFSEMKHQMKEDRIDFLDTFGKKFFGFNVISKPVSQPLLTYFRMLGSLASPRATEQCVDSFTQTDFRGDIEKIDVPVLIIHGGADKTVPIRNSSDRTAQLITDSTYQVYDGAPHGLFYTEKEQLNRDLINFAQQVEADALSPVNGRNFPKRNNL